jgi:hypothetical protein
LCACHDPAKHADTTMGACVSMAACVNGPQQPGAGPGGKCCPRPRQSAHEKAQRQRSGRGQGDERALRHAQLRRAASVKGRGSQKCPACVQAVTTGHPACRCSGSLPKTRPTIPARLPTNRLRPLRRRRARDLSARHPRLRAGRAAAVPTRGRRDVLAAVQAVGEGRADGALPTGKARSRVWEGVMNKA